MSPTLHLAPKTSIDRVRFCPQHHIALLHGHGCPTCPIPRFSADVFRRGVSRFYIYADNPYQVVDIGPESETLFGFGPEHFKRDASFWPSRLHPDDAEAAMASYERALQTIDQTHTMKYRWQHRNGLYLEVLEMTKIVEAPNGRLLIAGVFGPLEK